MRLDLYLAKKRNHLTRSKAQRAIRSGFIKVNDKIVKKPAYDLQDEDKVSITNRHLAKKPSDYFKLKEIQAKTNLIRPLSTVLVLAEKGYVLATSEITEKIIKDVSLSKVWPSEIGSVDLILNDLSLDYDSSIAAMHSVLSSLKRDGKILLTVRGKPTKAQINKALEKHELVVESIVRLASEKDEFYAILIRA